MNEEALFQLAREKTGGQRAAFLAEACGGDHALRQHLEALLAAADDPGGFLARPVLDLAATDAPHLGRPADDAPGLREAAGGRVGPYQLLREIGEGGMGSV